MGKHEEAIKNYNKAIKINPKNENVWYNKGITLSELEDRLATINYFYNKRLEELN